MVTAAYILVYFPGIILMDQSDILFDIWQSNYQSMDSNMFGIHH